MNQVRYTLQLGAKGRSIRMEVLESYEGVVYKELVISEVAIRFYRGQQGYLETMGWIPAIERSHKVSGKKRYGS